jgi:microsomal dipeptidase-like Zn-dependent dipeptidase
MRRWHRLAIQLLAVATVVAGLNARPAAPQASVVPESEVNATGEPLKGTTDNGEVRGFVDTHNHPFGNENLGGGVLCGKPWDPAGAAKALTDCPDHNPFGIPAWFENLTRTGSPIGTHDTRGWPTFKDWPASDSLTHQQTYYKWMERAWRGGMRVMVDLLVANRQLCDIYPIKKNACYEMDTVRLQAQRTHQLEAYVDSQSGGPGRGWFRVVRSPAEARQVIEDGKLAVVLGVEASEPFGCRQVQSVPKCTTQQIDAGLDEMYALGVRSMFVCHKFDNALCGVRMDSGTQGVIVNAGNAVSTGRFWQADTCTGPASDNTVDLSNDSLALLAGPLAALRPVGVTLPVYPAPPHCNILGLTALGEHMVRGMIQRGMIVEVDHMSQKAANRTLQILEQEQYAGVISGHSWTDPTYFRRIMALGGMVSSYGHRSDEYVENWRRIKADRDPRFVFGMGVGPDANGLGALPAKRPGSQVRYPFTSFDGGVTLDRQRTGQRVWDVNTDGVAHYGLLPDWAEDVKQLGGQEVQDDMARGAEAYLQMWQRAHG